MEAAANAEMEYGQEPPAAQYAQCRRLFCGRPGRGTVFGVTFSIASAYGEAGVGYHVFTFVRAQLRPCGAGSRAAGIAADPGMVCARARRDHSHCARRSDRGLPEVSTAPGRASGLRRREGAY